MKSKTILALLVLLGLAVASLEAQPFRRPFPSTAGIEGRWFYAGDPRQPCFVETIPGGFRGWEPRLVFTNERGEQSEGRFLPGGGVIAFDWAGGLTGNVRRNTIEWQNGTFWTR